MNRLRSKFTAWIFTLCLVVPAGFFPALTKAQSTSSGAGTTTTQPADPTRPTTTAPAPPPTPGSTAAPKTATQGGSASSQEIAAAKASGKVWVNTESRVYHKSGRWYGKTKQGEFMTESEAKAAGYKEAHR
jgi:hypothetical protein